jgi:2-succinyl-6-hydroxy-2,4-cyclohexadiene-1-carboxylate synthase
MSSVVSNGVRFHFTDRGHGNPLVLLHGFTGSSASWWPVIDQLAARHRVIAVDLIGHGRPEAPAEAARYAFDLALDDLAAIADHLGIVPATWLGYSMGGRLALGLALRHPEVVSALILESATAGIADPQECAARHRADDALADQIERDGVASFVDAWEALPMWASQRTLPREARQRQRKVRLANSPTGLANSLRGMGQGRQPSYWHRLAEIVKPSLLIAGEADEKFAGIARNMAGSIPHAALVIVPDAGHAVHLESPVTYTNLVNGFLDRGAVFADAAIGKEHIA